MHTVLNLAIGRLLAPYRPGGRQGDNQHSDNAKYTHFDGHFNGDRDAAVLYPRIARWICPGLSYKPLNTAIGRALAPIASSGQSNFGCFFVHPNR